MAAILFGFICCISFICGICHGEPRTALSPMDPSSFSRPDISIIKHISLQYNVDFEQKILHSEAVLNFEILKPTDELILDVKDLSIESIELSSNGEQLNYTVTDNVPNFGAKLTIEIPISAYNSSNTSQVEGNFSYQRPVLVGTMSTTSSFHLYKTAMGREQGSNESTPSSSSTRSDENTSSEICSVCMQKKNSRTQCECPVPPVPNNKSANVQKVRVLYEGLRIAVIIKYTTSPNASALQWLNPSQTSSKKYPYLFSQCQPIHARSILPCQDTPAVKFTYQAEVIAPCQYTALMSALRQEPKNNRTAFSQPVPIPSYLLALAVGVLEHRRLGPRSLVWAEKAEIEASAWEFAETEKYLQAAEDLCGPYQWSQYDLLVLPPSFPYGGMENPCLTFVTPTLLAGDRSQAEVIVHEIMHSWTGNLVTNRNFEHFWLNEGFTVFLERKVIAALIENKEEGKRIRDFESVKGVLELQEAIKHLGDNNPLTNLVVDLNGVHPDDSFSRVPYEKGSLFLRYLEDLIGGPEVFDEFLRSYLNRFQRESIDTDQFKSYLLDYFSDSDTRANLTKVNWDLWLHATGMPPVIPNYDTSVTKCINELVEEITNSTDVVCCHKISNLTPHQLIYFLQQLIDSAPLPGNKLNALDKAYRLSSNNNSEIKYRWLRLRIKSKDQKCVGDVFSFINSQGRMKYVRPIYRDLYAWEEVRQSAIDNFLVNEPFMMHVTAYTVRKDLHLEDDTRAEETSTCCH